MAKPRVYGQAAHYNPSLWRGVRDRRKNRPQPRPRESVTPKPVAGQIVKEKEATQ